MKFIRLNTLNYPDENLLPFVFLPGYESFVKETLKCEYLLAYSDNQNALMPFRKHSIKGFLLMQPLYSPLTLNGEPLTAEGEKVFLNQVVKKVTEEKLAIRITQAHSYVVFRAVPDNSVSCPFGTYVINLKDHTKEELFNAIHPRRRSYIRNAEKQNLEIRWGEGQLKEFYRIYKQTMDRSKMYCEPEEYFENLYRKLPNNIICGVVYLENMPQGAICIPYTQYGAFYLYGASSDNVASQNAINYLHWQAILLLKSKGVKRYDFAGARLSDVSGTKLEGIQNFKKRFGSELIRGYLWKMDINKFQCFLFDTLLGLKQRLSGKKISKDIIDEELEKPELAAHV